MGIAKMTVDEPKEQSGINRQVLICTMLSSCTPHNIMGIVVPFKCIQDTSTGYILVFKKQSNSLIIHWVNQIHWCSNTMYTCIAEA